MSAGRREHIMGMVQALCVVCSYEMGPQVVAQKARLIGEIYRLLGGKGK